MEFLYLIKIECLIRVIKINSFHELNEDETLEIDEYHGLNLYVAVADWQKIRLF
ncbi:hypothetical protein KUW03_11180 [Staphylococcaceae bacterium DP2N0-1]|nr:hypothetical protein [Staphylococcaceae bacterium DP2N0-1]